MTDPALGKAVLELSTDDTKFNAGLEQAKASAKGLEGHFKSTGQAAQALGTNLSGVGAGAQQAGKLISGAFAQFTLAGLATNAISSLISELKDFIITGSKLPAVEASYARLTKSLKQDGEEMLANMNAATRGVVSNYDLMLSANKAMLLGLPITAESMGELAKTATILGKAMGQDATKSLDDLITALGRSSPMILDNLGLTVKVGEANDAYAAKLGKIAEQLTEAEKKTAFYKAAMEAAKRKTEELGEGTRTLGEMAQAIWARLGDAISKEASKINNAFGPQEQQYAHQFFTTLGLDTAKAKEDLADLGRWVDVFTVKVSKLPTVTAPKPEMGALVPLPKLSIDELLAIGDALDKEREAHNKAAEAAKKHADAIEALFRKYSGADARAAMRDLDTVFRRLADSGQLTEQQIHDIVTEALRLQAEGAVLTDRLLAMALATDALGPGLSTAKLNLAELGTQIAVEIPKLDAFNAALAKMAALPDSGIIPQAPPRLGVDVGIPQIPKAPPETFWGSLFGSPLELGRQLSSTIIGALQGGGNPVSSAGSLVGSKIGSSIATSLTKEGGKLFNTALGDVLTGALPVVGSLIGPLASKLWDSLFSTKGRDTKLQMAKEAFGSVEEMQRQLVTLGQAEYDRLWKQFSEVGQKNKDQAVAAVNAIIAAIDAQKVKTEEAAQAAVESSAKQQEALDAITAKYADTIAAIDSEYKSLSDAVAQEAAEDVMGLVEAQQRARMQQLEDEKKAIEQQRDAEIEAKRETFDGVLEMAQAIDVELRELFGKPLEIPYVFKPLNGGLPAPSLFLPGQESGLLSSSRAVAQIRSNTAVIENRIILDGREIARNQMRHLPTTLQPPGVPR